LRGWKPSSDTKRNQFQKKVCIGFAVLTFANNVHAASVEEQIRKALFETDSARALETAKTLQNMGHWYIGEILINEVAFQNVKLSGGEYSHETFHEMEYLNKKHIYLRDDRSRHATFRVDMAALMPLSLKVQTSYKNANEKRKGLGVYQLIADANEHAIDGSWAEFEDWKFNQRNERVAEAQNGYSRAIIHASPWADPRYTWVA
jgi:hypothetical protein